MKLKSMGSSLIKKELNVVKIIRSIRDIKIFLKNYLIDEKMKFNVNHNKRNVIKLDSYDSDTSFDLGIEKITEKKSFNSKI